MFANVRFMREFSALGVIPLDARYVYDALLLPKKKLFL